MAINETVGYLRGTGFWGPATATLDWCEANYQFSHYIAEAANSFSNVFTVLMALYGAHQIKAASLPGRYLVGCTGFGFVGIGSFIFHATLLYSAQLADELPMIYVATYSLAILFDCEPGFSLRTPTALFISALYVTFNVLFTWSYAIYRNPVYHQVVFAMIMFMNAFRTAYLLRASPVSSHIPPTLRKTIKNIFGSGAGIFAFGFFIWNLDNIFCGTVTQWKHGIGWPTAFLLEGHSWWHLFTALGTYLMFVGNTYKNAHNDIMIANTLGFPRIVRASPFGKSKIQ
ncbi:alkaline phytoceramidase [Cristinia sonorae]|uniref:Alkaline phytoceramidase n=1 Tax=Cristinia sonorae TaxID=1940300 RepID=A0A8K0XRC0_9AGAR|nr:alkaline phytoceramidase [Cristinia sonorae]